MKKKMYNNFTPIFSKVHPLANINIPTKSGQILYLEKMILRLTNEVKENFENFDVYANDKLEEIENNVGQIVEGIAYDVVDSIAEDVVNTHLDNIQLTLAQLDSLVISISDSIDTMESDITQNQNDIEDLDDSLTTLSTTVSNFSDLIDQRISTALQAYDLTVDQKLEELDILDVDTVKSIIETENEDLEEQVSTNQADISALKDDLTTLDNIVSTGPTAILNSRVEDLEDELSSLRDEVNNMDEPDLSGVNASISALADTVNSYATQISTVAGEVSGVSAGLDSLSTQVDTLEDRIEAFENIDFSDFEGIIDNVNNLESLVGSLSSTVVDLSTLVEDMNIEDLLNKVKDVEEKVNVLYREGEDIGIDFGGDDYSDKNVVSVVSKLIDQNVYRGIVTKKYNTLEDFFYIEHSGEHLAKPLNVASTITGKSEYTQFTPVHYAYTNNGEQRSGTVLDAKVSVSDVDVPGYKKLKVHSQSLEDLHSELTTEGVTDFSITVMWDVLLVYEGMFQLDPHGE